MFGDERTPPGSNAPPLVARIVVAGASFEVAAERPFVFGRADAVGVVGLDGNDMGISAVAGSVELTWGVWWVINQSTKRTLFLQHSGTPSQITLPPGAREGLFTERATVLVTGAVYTHAVDIVLPHSYVAGMAPGGSRPSTGTLLGPRPALTSQQRDAVTAICAGYLEAFPRRREHPNTYAEAARLLGGSWTDVKVRKTVERVKARYARDGVYFDGPEANRDLAANLISNGVLTGADLARLSRRET